MFGDDRPGRVHRTIWLATGHAEEDSCARCKVSLQPTDVALYTRTRPGDPFDPWCADCTYTLVRWAGAGAVVTNSMESAAQEEAMMDLLHRGAY